MRELRDRAAAEHADTKATVLLRIIVSSSGAVAAHGLAVGLDRAGRVGGGGLGFLLQHQPAVEARRGAGDLDDGLACRRRPCRASPMCRWRRRPSGARSGCGRDRCASVSAMSSWPRRMWPVSGTQPTSDGIEQREDPVVVGAVEQQRVVVRTRMHRDIDAGLAAEFGGAVVELGGDGELVVARTVGHDRRRADRHQRAGKGGGEIDPALGGLEVGARSPPSA